MAIRDPVRFIAPIFLHENSECVHRISCRIDERRTSDMSRKTEIERGSSHGHFEQPTILPRMRGVASLSSINSPPSSTLREMANFSPTCDKQEMTWASCHETATFLTETNSRVFQTEVPVLSKRSL